MQSFLQNRLLLLFLLLLFQLSLAQSKHVVLNQSELIEINVYFENERAVQKFTSLGFTPDNSHPVYTTMQVTKDELATLEAAGLDIHNLTEEREMAIRSGRASFPSYSKLISDLMSLVSQNSTLAKADTIGYSTTNNEPIIEVTLTSSVKDLKPIYRITGTTHGNEKVGSEFTYELAEELLSKYNSDDTCKNILDNCIVKVVPAMCPDGYLGHSRYLAGRVDPNRQFGWQAGYYNGSDNHSVVTYPFASKELTAYYQSMDDDPWYFCLDYHTGITAVMVPWFADVSVGNQLMDYTEFYTVGEIYRGKMPQSFFSEQGGGKLMFGGYEQQGMPGIQTDWGYSRSGTVSINVEASQSQQQYYPSNYSAISSGNMAALKEIMLTMQKGIGGRVLDIESGEPVFARVQVEGKGFAVLSSPKSGNFFKYIANPSGSYKVTVTANGYETTTFTFTANSSGFSTQDLKLTRDKESNCAAMSVEYYRASTRPNQSDIDNILGLADGEGLELASSGGFSPKDASILLSMGNKSSIPNLEGDDITVYGLGTAEYSVYGSNDIANIGQNSTQLLGSGSGQSSFDISQLGLDSVRYIKIVSTAGEAPVIDAVEGWPMDHGVSVTASKIKGSVASVGLTVTPALFKIHSADLIGDYALKIYDMRGSLLQKSSGVAQGKTVAVKLSDFANGAYVCTIQMNNKSFTKRFILN